MPRFLLPAALKRFMYKIVSGTDVGSGGQVPMDASSLALMDAAPITVPVNEPANPLFISDSFGGISNGLPRTLLNANTTWASGGAGVSQQLKTIATGKVNGFISSIHFDTISATISKFIIRDETSDAAGTILWQGSAAGNQEASWTSPVPIKYTNGIRCEAGDQTINLTYSCVIVGWEE
jgi:hypothetical protein